MDFNHRLSISYYKEIDVINEAHKIYLVKHQNTDKIYVKKVLSVYNPFVYEYLYKNPIVGTPRIIDYCEIDNKLIIIEEFISGISLEEKIKSSDLTESEIIRYTTDLLKILKNFHNANPPIVNRDIKPKNVIITEQNSVILLDFNAAKIYSDSEMKDTLLLGTPGYAAPEQYGFGQSSVKTDIYAVGIMLKEMVQSVEKYNVKLDDIIKKCTQLNPNDRYLNIEDLEKDILSLNKFNKKNIIKYLPPGFRSRKPKNMIIASFYYMIIFQLSSNITEDAASVKEKWVYRLATLCILLFAAFISFNYLNVQSIFPLCKSKNRFIRYSGIIILNVISIFLILVIAALI